MRAHRPSNTETIETKILKHFILPSIFLVTIIGVYLFYFDDSASQTKKEFQTSPHEKNTLKMQVDAAPQNTEFAEPIEITQQEINQLNFDSEAERKQRRYREEKYDAERGLISPEERTIYKNYPLNTLQEMGKLGDIHALHELRGDYRDSDRIEKYLANFGAHSSGTYDEVKLDENDLQQVERWAQKIYASMEKRRIELGLGPFDNSIPEGSTAQLDKDRVLAKRARKN